MGALSVWHLAIVLGLVVLLFGTKKLPEMARSLGKSARILKSEAAAMKNDGPATDDAHNAPGTAQQTTAPRTIQTAALGDVAPAHATDEPKRTPQV
ncbi:Sec-independent protein translocase subunit TatA [Streptomyces apocyni]|uniref:Sec-independent protein translocase subunit TatA n=1 Tax=Streptomyces apocyni TaxID=2654677 RepID=UPI0012EB04BC|nr:Sec-independent protein translocase subunit TatA [Streptomyces apocyni]